MTWTGRMLSRRAGCSRCTTAEATGAPGRDGLGPAGRMELREDVRSRLGWGWFSRCCLWRTRTSRRPWSATPGRVGSRDRDVIAYLLRTAGATCHAGGHAGGAGPLFAGIQAPDNDALLKDWMQRGLGFSGQAQSPDRQASPVLGNSLQTATIASGRGSVNSLIVQLKCWVAHCSGQKGTCQPARRYTR
jgi:hypothetical protein